MVSHTSWRRWQKLHLSLSGSGYVSDVCAQSSSSAKLCNSSRALPDIASASGCTPCASSSGLLVQATASASGGSAAAAELHVGLHEHDFCWDVLLPVYLTMHQHNRQAELFCYPVRTTSIHFKCSSTLFDPKGFPDGPGQPSIVLGFSIN